MPTMTKTFRLMVVDDHVDTLELVKMTLAEKYDILALQNALEIYDMLKFFEPDLIILDIMMPKATGFQILDILQKNPAYARIPIVILSAKDSPHEIKHGYKLGAKLYLTKPFQPERLKKNVEFLLDHHIGSPRAKKNTIDQAAKQLLNNKSFKTGTVSLGLSNESQKIVKHKEFREQRKSADAVDDKLRDRWID